MSINYANLQFFVDWHRSDNLSMNPITNSGFEVNTTGWVIDGSGIGGIATSITRSATSDYYVMRTDGANGGVAILVTTATANSGTSYAVTGTFKTGRTYRYAVAIKSVSGTTSCKIQFGSLGTIADRAASTVTLTTGWVVYTVDWSPSANRTDVCLSVQNGTAAIMTVRFEDAMAYEAINDISADVDTSENPVTLFRGANFDGSAESPGTLNFTLGPADLVDLTNWKYARQNTSSVLSGLVYPGRRIWVRAINAGKVYPFFYGTIRRFVPRPGEIKVDVFCEDPLYELGKTKFTRKGLNQNVWEFRNAIITDAGIDTDTTIHHDFDKAGKEGTAAVLPEDDIFTFASGEDSLSLLAELNKATGTIHFCAPDANSDILWRYTTVRRQTLISATTAETFADDIADVGGYDLTDELLVNKQTVKAHRFGIVAGAKPNEVKTNIKIATGDSKYYWMTFDDYITGTPTVTATWSGAAGTVTVEDHFPQALNIKITAGAADRVLTGLKVVGVHYKEHGIAPITYTEPDAVRLLQYGKHRGQDIDSVFCQNRADALSLATYWVARYSVPRARPSIAIEDRHPSHLTRQISERVAFSFARMSLVGQVLVIRSLTTTVEQKGHHWRTEYPTEEIP